MWTRLHENPFIFLAQLQQESSKDLVAEIGLA